MYTHCCRGLGGGKPEEEEKARSRRASEGPFSQSLDDPGALPRSRHAAIPRIVVVEVAVVFSAISRDSCCPRLTVMARGAGMKEKAKDARVAVTTRTRRAMMMAEGRRKINVETWDRMQSRLSNSDSSTSATVEDSLSSILFFRQSRLPAGKGDAVTCLAMNLPQFERAAARL
jgi:hypothetical protein